MKFGIFSDLHMEFQPWYFEPDPDVFYLNAGDTHPNAMIRDYFSSVMGPHYFDILGNHDYYGGNFLTAAQDVFYREVNGFKIAGATLWTGLHPNRWSNFCRYMMDYRQIKGMTYDQYINAHDTHRKFLFESNADIWVIHHLPSYSSVHPDYENSDSNDFFATELMPWIEDMEKPPKLIVHGHTHSPCDYTFGEGGHTRVICHPRGYPGENSWFNTYQPKIIELEVE